MFGMSLVQVFSDSFGVRFESEDRQADLERRVSSRLATRHDFIPLTDQLKAYGFQSGSDFAKFVYLFQHKLGIKSGTRDQIGCDDLIRLARGQTRLTTMMECGIQPWDALQRL
jgi:hypothetical protein